MRPYGMKTEKTLCATYAKWKNSMIHIRFLIFLSGKTLVEIQGYADELGVAALDDADSDNGNWFQRTFTTKYDADCGFPNWITYQRWVKNSLTYKKVGYFSKMVHRGSEEELYMHITDSCIYLYLCGLSGSKDFYYTEPEWFNWR